MTKSMKMDPADDKTVVTFIHRWKYGFACKFDR